jgi:integrase/recombinase XerD
MLSKSEIPNTAFHHKLEVILEQYYEWLKVHNYRVQTIHGYKKCLKKFFQYIQAQDSISMLEHITPKVIYAFQSDLFHHEDEEGNRFSMSTQLGILSTLRGFFKYLYDSGRLAYDPSSTIKMPKRPHRLPYVPSLEEITKLLSAVDTTTPMGFRDRTIMEVLYATGMRAGELCALCQYDVDLNQNQLSIREGKGNKERLIPLGEIAGRYMQEYLTAVRPELAKDAGPSARLRAGIDEVFLSKHGKALLKTDMSQMIRKYRDLAQIEAQLTPHSLRHACASHLLKSGCDIRYIQQLLGHASLSTTQLYTKVEISDLKSVHQRFHPRERLADEL